MNFIRRLFCKPPIPDQTGPMFFKDDACAQQPPPIGSCCYDCGAVLAQPRLIDVRSTRHSYALSTRVTSMSLRGYCGRCAPAYDLVEVSLGEGLGIFGPASPQERYFVTVNGEVEVDAAGKPVQKKEAILCQLLPTKFQPSTVRSPARRSTRKPSARSRSRSRSRG